MTSRWPKSVITNQSNWKSNITHLKQVLETHPPETGQTRVLRAGGRVTLEYVQPILADCDTAVVFKLATSFTYIKGESGVLYRNMSSMYAGDSSHGPSTQYEKWGHQLEINVP